MMPTNRASIYFDPKQMMLMCQWLSERRIIWQHKSGQVLVKIEDGTMAQLLPHDLVTYVSGRDRDWVEVFTDGGDQGVHIAPIPKE